MNTGKQIIFFALLCIIASSGCQKEEYIEARDYPRLDLNNKIIQDASGILFEGIIISQAGEIQDKGFVWAEGAGASLSKGSTVSAGPGYGSGIFTAKVDYGLVMGLNYELRAYLISEGITVYSNPVNFISTIGTAN